MLQLDSKSKYKPEFNDQSQSSIPKLPELSFQDVEKYFSDLWFEQISISEAVNRSEYHTSNTTEKNCRTISSSDEQLYNTENRLLTNQLSIFPKNTNSHKMSMVENRRKRRWKTMARAMIPKTQYF
ncbi:unnamed protein product [Schistosoma margrebowiei]|uniref:Uncharacterized protein n=1 Tax=Schistosoma margrebowiei TaxID=48269 RepID=A0A183LQ03_9TREM|nr:unnamed protein product [Schistosoma margrebowiei]